MRDMKKEKAFYSLEFNKVVEKLKELAVTEKGKVLACSIQPYMDEIELKRNMRDTTEGRVLLDQLGTPTIPSMEHVQEYISSATKGEMLLPQSLEVIGTSLVGTKRLKDYLNRGKSLQVGLAYLEERMDSIEELKGLIYTSIRNGRVDDFASNNLKDIRRKIVYMEEKIKTKAESLLQSHKECFSDSFVVNRSGHICLPVKKDYKLRIPGSVIDKSSTGATLFIEPSVIFKLNEELQLLKMDEENEERVILYTLTGMVADYSNVFYRNIEEIIKLDFIFAKAKLSLEMKAIQPMINTEGYIEITEGKHPFIDTNKCIPLNIHLGEGKVSGKIDDIYRNEVDIQINNKCRGIVITGPNTGGKTVAIKTVGPFCLMAQSGLHIPCKKANVAMRINVLCDIGDGQNITENLSTFSAHITNILSILDNANSESLVILDELGSGTDPQEGMGIAIAILEELKEKNCLFLATTHYPEVKRYAENEGVIMNARMAFDKETLQPLYRLELGKSGESCALHIAKKLGMSKKLLLRAEQEAYRKSSNRSIVKNSLDFEENIVESSLKTEGGMSKGKSNVNKIKTYKPKAVTTMLEHKFSIGDSVMVYPNRNIGIIAKKVNDKGEFLVQLKKEKIRINHKRLKLHVKAAEMYPEDYDFSIIFDSVEARKIRHDMNRKYSDATLKLEE